VLRSSCTTFLKMMTGKRSPTSLATMMGLRGVCPSSGAVVLTVETLAHDVLMTTSLTAASANACHVALLVAEVADRHSRAGAAVGVV